MFGYCESTIVRLESMDINGEPHWTDVEVWYRSRPDTREVEVSHTYKGIVFDGPAIKAAEVYNNLIEAETACFEELAKYLNDERGLKSTVSVIKH